MARAFKCDICGKYFDPINNEIKGMILERVSCEGDPIFKKYYDVCDNCSNKINKLIESIKSSNPSTEAMNLAKAVDAQCKNVKIY